MANDAFETGTPDLGSAGELKQQLASSPALPSEHRPPSQCCPEARNIICEHHPCMIYHHRRWDSWCRFCSIRAVRAMMIIAKMIEGALQMYRRAFTLESTIISMCFDCLNHPRTICLALPASKALISFVKSIQLQNWPGINGNLRAAKELKLFRLLPAWT
jgi:hypothetical protein